MNQWKRAITPLYYRCCAIPNVLAYINTILSSFHNPYTSSKMVYIQSSLRILCIRSSSHRPYTSPNYNLDDAPSLRIITCHPHNVLSSLHFIPTSSFTLNTHLPTYLSFLWHIIPTKQHNTTSATSLHAIAMMHHSYVVILTHRPWYIILPYLSSIILHIPMSFYTSSYASSHHHHHPHTLPACILP